MAPYPTFQTNPLFIGSCNILVTTKGPCTGYTIPELNGQVHFIVHTAGIYLIGFLFTK